MTAINVTVRVNGGLFKRDIPRSVRQAMADEAVVKIGDRLTRRGARGSGGKGKGVMRNTVARDRGGTTETITSTRVPPRTKGTSWQRKNVAIARSMAGRVLSKAADRVVAEMGQ